MKATQILPTDYKKLAQLDLSKDTKALLYLNLAGLLLFFLFGYLFVLATRWLRDDIETLFSANWGLLVGLIGGLFGMVVLHELVHGFFFWLFTQEKPLFGFKGAYAYAAAPEWYLPRNQFLIVAVAPLVVLTIAGLVLIPLLPPSLLSTLILVLTFNASGAVGDLFVIFWLLTKSHSVLIHDVGDCFTIYGRGDAYGVMRNE